MKKWTIENATIITPDDTIESGSIVINNDKIEKVSKAKGDTPIKISMDDAVVSPGFINSHDHLLGTYWPKVGEGPYMNWLPWDTDLKSSPVYRERQQIEARDLYLLGAYRNLLSGVTSVQDHIPHFVQEPYVEFLPVKIISNFALSHSIASFALKWGDGMTLEYQKAEKEDIPFVTHINEGFDTQTVNDLKVLNQNKALGDHSVLVHGISFSEDDIDLIKEKGASTVWCCDSNMFMFEKTTNLKYQLKAGVNACIGTDSPMSGGVNLLHEMKFDKQLYKKMYKEELPDKKIVQMVTSNASRAFYLKENGYIDPGYLADFTIVKKKENAYDSIVSAELSDIKMVVINGMPVYGDKEYEVLFDELGTEYQQVTVAGKEKLIIGDLIGLLKRISRAVGFKKTYPFIPVDFDF